MKYKFYREKPFPHQLRGLKKALKLDKSCALLMDPGTGKTRVVIDFCGIKVEAGLLQKVLIIAPLAPTYTWEEEIKLWLPKRIPRQVVRLEGSIVERKAQLKSIRKVDRLTFVIVNYDVLVKMKDALKSWAPQCVVCDESHFIKHHTSGRSRVTHSIGPYVRWKFILSGTVITNSPMDIFSQYKFLAPSVFGTRWTGFKYSYARWGGFGGFKLLKYINLDDLQKKLHSIAFRASEDELDLPDKRDQVIKVFANPKTAKLYKQMRDEFIADIEDLDTKATAAIVLTKMLRLSQITGGYIKDDKGVEVPVGREKLEVLEDLLNTYCVEGRKKVVIFSRFRWEIKQIKEVCENLKVKAVVFGRKGGGEARRSFRDDPGTKVFISQIASGGVGINDLVVSSVCIFYSLDYSSDHLIQAKKRLHRPGQKENVLYIYLLMKNTLDTEIYRRLQKHQDLAHSIMDDYKKIVRG